MLDPLKVQFELSEPYGQWVYFLTKYMGDLPGRLTQGAW